MSRRPVLLLSLAFLTPLLLRAEIPVAHDAGLKARSRKERLERFLLPAMRAAGLKAWLVVTREGTIDPVAFDVGLDNAVARAAGLFVDDGGAKLRSFAAVASYDVDGPKSSGLYEKVGAYGKEGLGPSLKKLLEAEAPGGKIGLNVAPETPLADGLTAGTRDWLVALVGPSTSARFVSSEPALLAFRAKKTPAEIEHIRAAVKATDALLREALSTKAITVGKTTEKELADWIHRRMKELSVGDSWEAEQNPNVVATVSRGHSASGGAVLKPGTYARIDFGIDVDGYKTDLQRSAYLLRPGETAAPEAVLAPWRVAVAANAAGVKALRPGARGLDVDIAARKTTTGAGYPEYVHATGHPIGFFTHDVGPMLGPDWPERYGRKVFLAIGVDETYAVEPAVPAEIPWMGGTVDVASEENVVVTKDGAVYLTPPQTELILIPAP